MEDISWIPSFERDQQEKERQEQPDLKTQTEEILKLIDKMRVDGRQNGELVVAPQPQHAG